MGWFLHWPTQTIEIPRSNSDRQVYTIQYTGTPFKNARYQLKADAATKGILLKIPYPNAGSYSVKVNGNLIEP